MIKCPKCQDEDDLMQQEEYQGITIERCPICKGVFLDQGELTSLIETKQGNKADQLSFSATSDAMDGVYAFCHRCDQEMVSVKLPGDVVGNQCQKCAAIFLDHGELATIQLQYR
jgi:Zn-finger nucleic acid-binding protein